MEETTLQFNPEWDIKAVQAWLKALSEKSDRIILQTFYALDFKHHFFVWDAACRKLGSSEEHQFIAFKNVVGCLILMLASCNEETAIVDLEDITAMLRQYIPEDKRKCIVFPHVFYRFMPVMFQNETEYLAFRKEFVEQPFISIHDFDFGCLDIEAPDGRYGLPVLLQFTEMAERAMKRVASSFVSFTQLLSPELSKSDLYQAVWCDFCYGPNREDEDDIVPECTLLTETEYAILVRLRALPDIQLEQGENRKIYAYREVLLAYLVDAKSAKEVPELYALQRSMGKADGLTTPDWNVWQKEKLTMYYVEKQHLPSTKRRKVE